MNTVEIIQIRDNIVFRKPELVEVQIIKVPRSIILNNYVRQTGTIIYVSNDCSEASVKLESGKIVKFPIKHLRRIQRYIPSKVYESVRHYRPKVETGFSAEHVLEIKEDLQELYDRETDQDQDQDQISDSEETGDIYDSGDVMGNEEM